MRAAGRRKLRYGYTCEIQMQIQLRRDTFVCIQMRMQINGKEIVAAADAINFTCHADVAPKSASFDVSRATATAATQRATATPTPTAMLQVSIRAEFATQIENLCGTLTIYQQNCWDFPAWQLQCQIIAAKHMQNNKYFKMPPQWHSDYKKILYRLK